MDLTDPVMDLPKFSDSQGKHFLIRSPKHYQDKTHKVWNKPTGYLSWEGKHNTKGVS